MVPDDRFESFQRDIMQRLSSKIGREIDLFGEKSWFDMGMMYSDLGLNEHNDEVAAEFLANHIIKEGLF